LRGKRRQKTLFVLPITLLIFVILCSSIIVSPIFATDGTNEAWELEVGRNISGLAVVDGKVFTTTHAADLLCLDQQNGQTLWTHNFGEYSGGGFLTAPVVADGRVFVGSRGSTLNCLDENNGSILWQFTPNLTSSFAFKTAPSFSVADGKAFTTGDGFYVLNVSTGKLLWGYQNYNSMPDFVGGWPYPDGKVFGTGMESINKEWIYHLYRFDPNNGTILWKLKLYVRQAPLSENERLIVWSYDEGQTMLCLDETDGSTLWSYNVGATVFQPTAYNGLLLFGASNGGFYALNVSDGTFKWEYQTMTQIVPRGSVAPQVASGKVFISYEDGYIRSLNLSNAHSIWAAPISSDVSSLTLGNDTLYAIAGASTYMSGTKLHSIDLDNGNINWVLNFTYWVLPPIYAYDKLFVAADLKIIAYGEPEPAKNEVLWGLLITGGIISVGAVITVALYWLRRRRIYLKGIQ